MDYEIREIDRTALKGEKERGKREEFSFSLGFPFAFLHSILLSTFFLPSTLLLCYASTRLVQSSAVEVVEGEETLRGCSLSHFFSQNHDMYNHLPSNLGCKVRLQGSLSKCEQKVRRGTCQFALTHLPLT